MRITSAIVGRLSVRFFVPGNNHYNILVCRLVAQKAPVLHYHNWNRLRCTSDEVHAPGNPHCDLYYYCIHLLTACVQPGSLDNDSVNSSIHGLHKIPARQW